MLTRDAPSGKLGHRAGGCETEVLMMSSLRPGAQMLDCAFATRMLAQLIGITRTAWQDDHNK
jgi:hypothetical protein